MLILLSFSLVLVLSFVLSGRDIHRETEVLKGHLWRGGPTIWPLSSILAAGQTISIQPQCTISILPVYNIYVVRLNTVI